MGNVLAKLQTRRLDGITKTNLKMHQFDKLFRAAGESGILILERYVKTDAELEMAIGSRKQKNMNVDNVLCLRLVGTRVKTIPVSIGIFSHLVDLDLSNNYIDELPWSIVYLKQLEIMNLSYNLLTNLPCCIGCMRTLVSINLCYNNITYLPTEILYLTRLEQLDVTGNKTLISPPLTKAEKGVDAVMDFLRMRSQRKDMWGNRNQKPDFEKSLFELCINCILKYKVEFLELSYVPPVIKTHLLECTNKMGKFAVSKCSRCKCYFSTTVNFEMHLCK
uniref:Leucine-rich repeat protein soc-2 homolog n=1 Tax=Saccoglossus kowalevskii TaxID=10224 RepID=A0ABM0LXA3_SACKO|nr:PREDICTED: leucine-rich repeat protein soc-2 homolog [Saccoglossus kowalevskii]